ncbi:MAG TPA: hypothetical protein VFS91_00720 [Nitrobacter sp.]|nr:hypothetical protein [Nitrobacter sp.]
MAGIGVATTSAVTIMAVLVLAFIAAVRVAPECTAAGEAMVDVTAVAMAQVTAAVGTAAAIRAVHLRLA